MDIQEIKWRWWHDTEFSLILGEDLWQIKDEVNSGVCQLYGINGYGYTIIRREKENKEFVFVGGIGRNAKEVIRYFVPIAKKEGFEKMRIHSKRKGMGKYLKDLGFYQTEDRGYEKVFHKGLI